MIRLAAMLLSLLNLFAACGIPTSRTTIIPEDVGQTPEQIIGKLSYMVFYEGRLTGPPTKPENFHQVESTRLYISDLLGSMFKLGASRGVSQIGD